MKLKAIILLSIIISTIHFSSFAQIGIGGSDSYVGFKPYPFNPESLDALKKTKTIFFYGPNDKDELDNWKKLFADVWTITPVEFVSYDQISSYLSKPGYSFLTIGGFNLNVKDNSNSSISLNYDIIHTYLQLWMRVKDKKGNYVNTYFSRIELFPTYTTLKPLMSMKATETLDFIYTKGKFYNWYPGLLKGELTVINTYLKEGKSLTLYGNSADKVALDKLKSETLYIPDYVLIKFKKMSGDESERFDEKELLKDYTNKYKILPAKELSDKILASNDPFYYFLYTKSSTNKFLSVINNGTGDMIYSKYKAAAYNMGDSDFKDLMNP